MASCGWDYRQAEHMLLLEWDTQECTASVVEDDGSALRYTGATWCGLKLRRCGPTAYKGVS